MQLVEMPAARASEETFRPVVPASVKNAAPLKLGSGLKWRARGTSVQEPRQAAVRASDSLAPQKAEAKQATALELVPAKPATAVRKTNTVEASRFSSKKTRDRLRESVMQVNAYQESDAAPFSETAPATSDPNSLRDPFESDPSPSAPTPSQPSPSDAGAAPPGLPTEIPAPSDDPPPPVDDLFRDDPIRTPRQPAELPPEQREQLLEEGLSTEPGGIGCESQHEQCQRALQELQKRDITTITVGLLIEGVEGTDFPCDCRLGRDFDAPQFAGRNFAPTLFTWKASGTCHKPLYFEDVQLERYGHSWNPIVQPFMSGAHFFVSVPLLPYKMGLRPPNECVYTLGYYRPGSCAPYFFEPIPLSLRGAVWEGFGAAAFAFWFWPPN